MQKTFHVSFQRFRFSVSLIVLFLSFAVLFGCGGDSGFFDTSVARTDNGFVKGYVNNNTLIWKGIPYAKPPVGDLRFRPPQDSNSWLGIRSATTACSECSQLVTDKFWRPTPGAYLGSEDCLYLDIYRPNTSAANLPVYVWIHGGANIMGSAKLYDGSELAKRGNMIVVVIQYRLGMFGWLTHPAFRAAGTPQDISGNYGTLDHMKALAWVQNNIDAFGGDPANVTIGGQSAGGQHIMNLIISPMANNFHRAFAESPALSQLMPLRTFADGDTQTNAIIDWLLVDDGTVANPAAAAAYRGGMSNAQIMAYLRGKTSTKVMQAAIAGPGQGSMPVPTSFLDGAVLPTTSWLETISAGNFKKVPLIIGSTKYEYKDLMTLYGTALKLGLGVPSGAYSWGNVYDVLNGTRTFDEVLPTAADKFNYEQSGLLKSRKWQYDVNQIARAVKANNAANIVYSYYFTWAGGGDPNLENFRKIFGASHAQDVPFFFGENDDLFKGYSFTAANQAGRVALQGVMMDYLCGFANVGDPNQGGQARLNWTQWSNTDSADKFIIFDAGLAALNLSMSPLEATKTAVNTDIGTAFFLNPNPSVIPLPSPPYPPGTTTTVFHLLAGVLGFLPIP